MIKRERLEQLKELLRQRGMEASDAIATEVGIWLLARARSVSYTIPFGHEHLWRQMAAQAQHPHDQSVQSLKYVVKPDIPSDVQP